ncbi:hypothetical protein NQ318_010206 [Aromia moschata]|uniref:CHK kinase-like domain-containing protein n=1 Tax=Aromia moschata TaxID=1265417 RepID=A0AAV8Y0M1_9CUCU|nr:hypothetical protein NQ318_010206 [Aromia moschata]
MRLPFVAILSDTMKLIEIRKIEEILLVDKPLLTHKVNGSVAGDDGSLLVNVELRLKNEKNFEEKFEVVAKLLAPSINGLRMESFKNELAFYTKIVPLLEGLLKTWGAEPTESFPNYYGGRLTLNPKIKETDRDAVFFLENLKTSGFQAVKPHIGFNFETTKLILRELAKFHASFLAVKLRKPESFKHEVRPYVNTVNDPEISVDDVKQIVSLMWENEGCVSLIPRVRRAMSCRRSTPREPFATIIHGDFWTSNIMVKLEGDKPEKMKIVDFQKFTYDSPAADLVYFLFTSLETPVLEDNFDELTDYYYKNLISALENFECDVATFSLGELLKEINIEAKNVQFPRIMMKLNTIFDSNHTEERKERGWFIVQEFAKRNWI